MSMLISQDPHGPLRPEWRCRHCGLPYPCPEGRIWLIAVYGFTRELAQHAAALLDDAAADMPDTPLAELWGRFVAWTEPAPPIDVGPGPPPAPTSPRQARPHN